MRDLRWIGLRAFALDGRSGKRTDLPHLSSRSTSPHSSANDSSRHALLVLDVQEVFTRSSGRSSLSSQAFDQLTDTINGLSQVASEFGIRVIYARQERESLVAKSFSRMLMKKVDGNPAMRIGFDKRLKMVSEYSFVKPARDAFSNVEFDGFLRKNGIAHLYLAGVDGMTSIKQTARSALDLGYRVKFIKDGIFTAFESRWERELEYFESAAAFGITGEEFAELAATVHRASEAQRKRSIAALQLLQADPATSLPGRAFDQLVDQLQRGTIMRMAIDTVGRDGQFVILEDEVSGTYAVARWSADTAAWISEDGAPSRIAPTHWHPLLQEHDPARLPEDIGPFRPAGAARASPLPGTKAAPGTVVRDTRRVSDKTAPTAAPGGAPTDIRGARRRREIAAIAASLVAAAVAGWWLYRSEVANHAEMTMPVATRAGADVGQVNQVTQRERGEALIREPKMAQRELEMSAVLSRKASDEASQAPQAAEHTAVELQQAVQQARDKAETLTRDLAAARREIESQTTTARTAGSEAAQANEAAQRSTTTARQALEEERTRADALTRDLDTARREIEALKAAAGAASGETAQAREAAERSTATARQAVEEERTRADALARDLAAARLEVEAQVAASGKSGEEATRLLQAAVRAAAELQQALQREHDKAEKLARELATARRELGKAPATDKPGIAQFPKSDKPVGAAAPADDKSATAAVSPTLAQAPATSGPPQFRDPKTGQIWTPENVGRGQSGPNTPADRAFDPRGQTTVERPAVQIPAIRPLGTVPITAGPTVPIASIDDASLVAIASQRSQVGLYLNNNSAGTISPVIDCRFTNSGATVQEVRANLPPVGAGRRVGLTVYGPPTNLFVDRAECRLTSP